MHYLIYYQQVMCFYRGVFLYKLGNYRGTFYAFLAVFSLFSSVIEVDSHQNRTVFCPPIVPPICPPIVFLRVFPWFKITTQIGVM